MSPDKVLYKIDLKATIIPGKSAAGFELGIKKESLSKELIEKFVANDLGNTLSSSNVILYFQKNILTQIAVKRNYQGKLESGLGLNDLVKTFSKAYGKFIEGYEDQLIFENLGGLCFEVDETKYSSENWTFKIPSLPIKELYIYKTH